MAKGSLPSFVIACTAAYSLRRITRYAIASSPAIAKTAVNPGASFFGFPAVVPSAAGGVVFAAAGFTFVGAGVTRLPGGTSVAVVVAAGAFVAVTVGVGVPPHPGGYVPPPPPDGVGGVGVAFEPKSPYVQR
jgi:hypothetical protein